MLKVVPIVPSGHQDLEERAPLSERGKLAIDALFSISALKRFVACWFSEQIPLVEAFCLALTFHVLLLPVLWIMGWALPWPKSPVITTVIELDLSNWPHEAKPDKVENIRDPELNR